MRAEVRHQLKQDRFSKATLEVAGKTVHWTVEHKSKLIVASVAALALAAALLGGWYYLNQQDQKASVELNRAVRTMNTPLRAAGQPAQPEFPTFASSKDRATEARKELQAIVADYPHTHSADFARYFLGVTDAELGDSAGATRTLRDVAQSHNQEISSLANLALASVYRGQKQPAQAIEIYNSLIAKPTTVVTKTTAQLELAEAYREAQRPLDAKRIYEQMQKENPGSEVAQIASEKLQALK